jgi:hypothetical protein
MTCYQTELAAQLLELSLPGTCRAALPGLFGCCCCCSWRCCSSAASTSLPWTLPCAMMLTWPSLPPSDSAGGTTFMPRLSMSHP